MKLDKLEAIRGFAAFYVVIVHTVSSVYLDSFEAVDILFSFGQEAVILFFLLSGFVIYYAQAKALDKSPHKYFKKRFLRIYIPLFPVLLIAYIAHQLGVRVADHGVGLSAFILNLL